MKSLDFAERESLREDLPPFRVGDAVRVHVRVTEGDKERIQVFEGLVIRRRGGGLGETFTVRKIASGVGVERIFPVQSPLVTRVEVKSRGFVRRSRLYYLRNLSGKKARLKSKVRDLSELVAPDLQASEDVVAEEVVVEESAEGVPEEPTERVLRGKARKRIKAQEKAKRMETLKAEQAEAAQRQAEEEAERAAQAASEEESSESDAGEAPAAEAQEVDAGEDAQKEE